MKDLTEFETMLVSGGADASRELVPGTDGTCYWIYDDDTSEPADCPPDPNLNPDPPAGCYDSPDPSSPGDITICIA